MKGREAKGPPSADLLVCFPSRTHLNLMHKPICSPARPSEPTKRHHLKKSTTRRGGGGGGASPFVRANNKSTGSDISEPTSPKINCAGQIKVRPKAGSCKSWQSVMEEIERIHNNRSKQRKQKSNWVENFGFKKDIMQFLTCLRSVKFDFRCFGPFSQPDVTSDDDEEDDEQEEKHVKEIDGNEGSRTVFSKWFMVLQENQNQNNGFCREENIIKSPNVPPPNALLLMRCRSAPAKNWVEEKVEEEEKDDGEDEDEEKDGGKGKEKVKKLKLLMEEEKKAEEAERRKKTESLVVMKYEYDHTDFYKFSGDIAKETWLVGGIRDVLSRSRSSKR